MLTTGTFLRSANLGLVLTKEIVPSLGVAGH